MPPKAERIKLVPAAESDRLNPGSFYLACLNLHKKPDPDSYWIVLRAPREWLPDGFFDQRPVQARVFAFWLVDKDQRVWLPKTSLFCLDPSQAGIFTDKIKRQQFRTLLGRVQSLQTPDAALRCFEKDALASKARYNERRERVDDSVREARRSRSSSGLTEAMEDYIHDPAIWSAAKGKQSGGGQAASRREQRRDSPQGPGVNTPASGRNFNFIQRPASLPLTPQVQQQVQQQVHRQVQQQGPRQVRIKTEAEERQIMLESTIMDEDRVRIYVGQANICFAAKVSVIRQKSPIMNSLIVTGDANEGKYIMHPKMQLIVPNDFLAVLEFMENGEYEPLLVANHDGNAAGPLALKNRFTTEQYSEALIQAGRLYILARMFQIRGLPELIFRKITRAQYRPYSNLALIELAYRIMTRPIERSNPTPAAPQGKIVFEPLDRWVIEQLAENFMQMMRSELEQRRYVALVHATSKRQLHAEVMERAAARYRNLGGLPVVIDDN